MVEVIGTELLVGNYAKREKKRIGKKVARARYYQSWTRLNIIVIN